MTIEFSRMSEGDLDWFLSIRNKVRFNLHNPKEFTLEEAKHWWNSNDLDYWVIEAERQKIGYFRLVQVTPTKIQIGADIDPAFQGRGYSYISYLEFTKKVLFPRGIKDLELRVLKTNFRAYNLYKKLGFQEVDENENDFLMYSTVQSLMKKLEC